MMALSINLHGGWVQGVAMLVAVTGAVAAMEVRRRSLGRGATSLIPLRYLAMVLGACVLALLLNPHGWRGVAFPLDMQASWIRAIGPEWQSPFPDAGWRAVGGGRDVTMQPAFFLYLALLVGMLLAALKRWRTVDLIPVAVMTMGLVLGLWHLRCVADAMLLTAPFVASEGTFVTELSCSPGASRCMQIESTRHLHGIVSLAFHGDHDLH